MISLVMINALINLIIIIVIITLFTCVGHVVIADLCQGLSFMGCLLFLLLANVHIMLGLVDELQVFITHVC